MKWKRFFIISGIGLVLALGFRFYLQQQTSQVPRGSTAVYAIDASGNARVEISDRIYFSRPDIEQNFDSYLDRIGGRSADVEVLAKSMREKVDSLSKSLGRQMTVDGFAARVVKEAEFGGRKNEFNWQAFAALNGATWKVAFPQTEQILMNDHSSLALVLPAGARVLSTDPEPDTSADGVLTWRGPREMPWPVVEYQVP
jgi:hypothetical protein